MGLRVETNFDRALKGDYGPADQVKAKACRALGITFADLKKPEVVQRLKKEIVGSLNEQKINLLATFGGND